MKAFLKGRDLILLAFEAEVELVYLLVEGRYYLHAVLVFELGQMFLPCFLLVVENCPIEFFYFFVQVYVLLQIL